MENASKALIIAGAILLSILIIALGIYVFNMAKGATNTNQLDDVEKSAFNSPFTNYEGKQIGTSVKELISKTITNATTNSGADEKLVDIKYVDANQKGKVNNTEILSTVANLNVNAMSNLRKAISASHYYTVECDYDNTTGLVNKVTIYY